MSYRYAGPGGFEPGWSVKAPPKKEEPNFSPADGSAPVYVAPPKTPNFSPADGSKPVYVPPPSGGRRRRSTPAPMTPAPEPAPAPVVPVDPPKPAPEPAPVRDPNRFGASEVRSYESVLLERAQAQQSQQLSTLGRAFVATGVARKATPEEVAAGRGVTPTQTLVKVVATGGLSDVSRPLTSIRAAGKGIAPGSYRGASRVNLVSKEGQLYRLRSFDGVVSDSKGAMQRAAVKEIKVESSGLVFREEKVARKVTRSVFTERDLFVVEKPKPSGRILRAGLREETDIGRNVVRTVSIDETVVIGEKARVGGIGSIATKDRVTSTLGANRRGSLLLRPEKPSIPNLQGARFVGSGSSFVRPPSAPEVVETLRFAKPTTGLGNRITSFTRRPEVVEAPTTSFATASDFESRPRPVVNQSQPEVLRPIVNPIREAQPEPVVQAQSPFRTPARRIGGRSPQRPIQSLVPSQTPSTPQRPRTPLVQRPFRPARGPLVSTGLRPPVQVPRFQFDPDFRGRVQTGGFRVFVRRGGEFKPTGPVLSRSEALEFGAFQVDSSPAASFKIKPAGAPTGSFGGKGFFGFFSPSKRESGVFVEPAKRRIRTPGEKRGITFKGIQAKRLTTRRVFK